MSKLLRSLQTKDSLTSNSAVTNSTSLNNCVDMFFLAGASRHMSEKDMISVFEKAFIDNPLMAMKILFWSRDVRGGAGERNFFQTIMKHLEKEALPVLKENLSLVPHFGYWKDLWSAGLSFDTYKHLIKKGLEEEDGLLAKWLPRKGLLATKVREYLGLTPKEYRKKIVALSNTVEQKMSAKEFGSIEYDKIPSKAFNKYRKAFERNDEERFTAFIEDVQKGDKKINAGSIFPYDLYLSFKRGDPKESIDAQWSQLPDYLEDTEKRMLPMIDTSGSMGGFWGYGRTPEKGALKPIDISVSLGVYLSERNKGPFKDAFLRFHSNAKLKILKGTPTQRFEQLQRDNDWGGSTNIISAFELILDTAKRDNLGEEDLPTDIIIISDMEFNSCTDLGRSSQTTAYDRVKQEYEAAGYSLPNIIFWNANGRIGNSPVQADTPGTALVSGASPAIVASVLEGEDLTPYGVMASTVAFNERYDVINLPNI